MDFMGSVHEINSTSSVVYFYSTGFKAKAELTYWEYYVLLYFLTC